MIRLAGAARLLAAGLLALAFAAAPADAARTLRVTLQLPLESNLGANLLLFKAEVERLSGGVITIDIRAAGAMMGEAAVPTAVASGVVEMGVASLTQYARAVPAVEVFHLPSLLDTDAKILAAVAPDSPVRQAIDRAILSTGARVLWWQAYGSTILLSKAEPVRMPEDIRGMRVRVFGRTLGRWVESVGGIPVAISGADQKAAYRDGRVEVGMTGIFGVEARALWDVMETVTRTNLADIEFVVLINEELWNSLSDEERGWIRVAAAMAERASRTEMTMIESRAYQAAEANGMTVYDLTPEEREAWRAASQPLVDQWLAEAGALGRTVYDAAVGF
jgi:C4-dicarboxylate-binding protein DctP